MLGPCFKNGEWLAVPCGVMGSEMGKRSFQGGDEIVNGVGSLVGGICFILNLIHPCCRSVLEAAKAFQLSLLIVFLLCLGSELCVNPWRPEPDSYSFSYFAHGLA